ncbi:pentapeptide repeat-containing protein [Myxococcus virescens]|uniref:pentapeptide repeat-containing protein n=1 Tax=Myxococcus virescens TaxID=83456 RepID=UPI003DA2B721
MDAVPLLPGTVITGTFDLDSVEYDQPLRLPNAVFDGHVNLRDARIKRSVDFSGCRFEKNLNFCGARIGGSLQINEAIIQDIHQPGHLRTIDSADSDPSAQFERLHVEGDFEAAGLDCRATLSLSDARIGGQLFLSSNAGRRSMYGRNLLAHNIKVGGQVRIDGVRVKNELNLQGADIAKDLFITCTTEHSTTIGSDAWLVGIDVKGQVHFSGTSIHKTLALHNSDIKESISFTPHHDSDDPSHYRQTRVGKLNMSNCRIGGNIDMRGLIAVGIEPHASSDVVNLMGVKAGGELRCDAWSSPEARATQEDPIPPKFNGAVNLRSLRVTAAEFDGRMCKESGPDLRMAEVGNLTIQQRLWRGARLDGMQFRDLNLLDGDAAHAIELLKNTEPFQRSAYIAAEKHYRDRGEDEIANKIYIAMRMRNREKGMSWWQKPWDWFLGFSIKYGVAPHRVGIAIVGILAITTLLFSTPPALAPLPTLAAKTARSATYGERFWQAFRTTIPVVTIYSGGDWRPSSEPITIRGIVFEAPSGWALRYDQYASFVSVLSWILVPLFLASVTGLVKRR